MSEEDVVGVGVPLSEEQLQALDEAARLAGMPPITRAAEFQRQIRTLAEKRIEHILRSVEQNTGLRVECVVVHQKPDLFGKPERGVDRVTLRLFL